MTDDEIKRRMRKIENQHNWEEFQRFIAFSLIPFIVIALIVSCFMFGLFSWIAMISGL